MNTKKEHEKIDWMITLVPLAIVIALCVLFFFAPEQSNAVLSQIRFFFGDTFGTYYLVIGLGIFILSLYIAGSAFVRTQFPDDVSVSFHPLRSSGKYCTAAIRLFRLSDCIS